MSTNYEDIGRGRPAQFNERKMLPVYLDSDELEMFKQIIEGMDAIENEQVSASKVARNLIVSWIDHQRKARKTNIEDSILSFRRSA